MNLKIAFDIDQEIEVQKVKDEYLINGVAAPFQLLKSSEKKYLLHYNHVVYSINILRREHHLLLISINGKVLQIHVKDHITQTLEQLGMDLDTEDTVQEISAPMPGGILEVAVNEGDEVKKGEKLIVLEAMKMENIIKAPGDGVVSKINVAVGDTVEKNQTLLSF